VNTKSSADTFIIAGAGLGDAAGAGPFAGVVAAAVGVGDSSVLGFLGAATGASLFGTSAAAAAAAAAGGAGTSALPGDTFGAAGGGGNASLAGVAPPAGGAPGPFLYLGTNFAFWKRPFFSSRNLNHLFNVACVEARGVDTCQRERVAEEVQRWVHLNTQVVGG